MLRNFLITVLILLFPTLLKAQHKLAHPALVAKGRSDGRFTIGAGQKKLMYGYPVPFSTSHFLVAFKEKVKGKSQLFYASNSPHFNPEKVTYVTTKPVVKGESNAPYVECVYDFKNIQVRQKLTPLGKNFKPTDLKTTAQWYKVEYEILYNGKDEAAIGLQLLFDTMINENDACEFEINGKKYKAGVSFKESGLPKEILMYETPGNKKNLLGQIITQKPEADVWQPDEIHVGTWNVLHEVIWEVDSLGSDFKDSAVLLKWNAVILKPKQKTNFALLYGVPSEKPSEVSLLINDLDMLDEKLIFFYELNESKLADSSKLEIDNFVKSHNVIGVTIHGYSDAVGTDEAAEKISWKRIEEIKEYIKKYELPLIFKPHGKAQADLSKKEGNPEDRKAEVVFFYKK
jgi:outer membrane protein OmpA-like peptidoglycan-associated protein